MAVVGDGGVFISYTKIGLFASAVVCVGVLAVYRGVGSDLDVLSTVNTCCMVALTVTAIAYVAHCHKKEVMKQRQERNRIIFSTLQVGWKMANTLGQMYMKSKIPPPSSLESLLAAASKRAELRSRVEKVAKDRRRHFSA